MKVTKLVHSCLIVEQYGKKALVDPGSYSWQSGIVQQESLRDIDYVLITHIHADHYDPEFCNVVNELSPNALWYAPPEVVEKLTLQGIQNVSSQSSMGDVIFIESTHADGRPWFETLPEHSSFVLFGELLVSGDHQAFMTMHGARILAGAFTAPWGSLAAGARMIELMGDRPQIYLPVHDWHLNDVHRVAAYDQAEQVYGGYGVRVLKPVDGVSFEL